MDSCEYLKNIYKQKYNKDAQYYSNAPGRVNIIGEHVDHQYYDVLPTCINRSIKLVGSTLGYSAAAFSLENMDSERFPLRSFASVSDIQMQRGTKIAPIDYVLSGVFGLLEYVSTPKWSLDNVGKLIDTSKPHSLSDILSKSDTKLFPEGLHILMDGDIPIAAGTSSSSALVVASIKLMVEAIDVPEADKKDFTPKRLAEIAIIAEKHTGVQGGGMDQSIICMGAAGQALRIGFSPLTTSPVSLPEDMKLVVCNSAVKSAKGETAPFRYNKRVLELRLGNRLLGGVLSAEVAAAFKPTDLPRTRDIEHLCKTTRPLMLKAVEQLDDSYSKEALTKLFHKETIESALKLCGQDVWELNSEFKLKQAIRHVLTEMGRVEEFHATCKKGLDEYDTLGKLMDGSQQSLKDDFEASVPEIDQICAVARANGAFGARITGAGWGGCCVLGVRSADIDRLQSALVSDYFVPTLKVQQESGEEKSRTILPSSLDGAAFKNFLFTVVPSDSAKSGRY